MGRGVENLDIILETVLRSIAVVDVEVQDRDAPDVMVSSGHHADRHIVEEAEPHGSRVFGVVPWRTHDGEGVPGPAIEDAIDALDDSSRRGARGHHGIRRDVCVGIEVATARRRGAIEHRHVARVMDAMDGCVRRRGSRLHCKSELGGGDRFQSRRDTLRSLRMTLSTVAALFRVREQGDHARVRARKATTG